MNLNVVKEIQPRNWRTAQMHQKYTIERQQAVVNDTCIFCEEKPQITFNYWKIIPNRYPYDAVAIKHDLLYPVRHVAKLEALNNAELKELAELKETYLNEHYVFIAEAVPKNKSIPGHFHLHLIEPKIIQ